MICVHVRTGFQHDCAAAGGTDRTRTRARAHALFHAANGACCTCTHSTVRARACRIRLMRQAALEHKAALAERWLLAYREQQPRELHEVRDHGCLP